MNRLEKILNNPLYWDYLHKNHQKEIERIYCKHNWEHLALTAQLTQKLLREKKLTLASDPLVNLEIVGAAGILHDIGRWLQYETGEDHAQTGSRLARPLLEQAGYSQAEIDLVCQAILEHNKGKEAQSLLGQMLCLADDLSRPCSTCQAQKGCYKMPWLLEQQKALGYLDFDGDEQEKFWRCLDQNGKNH